MYWIRKLFTAASLIFEIKNWGISLNRFKGVEKLSLVVEIAMFVFRLLFYVFALIDVYSEKETIESLFLVFGWLIAAMAVPAFFWIPRVYRNSTYYCLAELLLNGSLTLYSLQFSTTYNALFIISALTISFHLEKRLYWLLPVMLVFPFIQFFQLGMLPNESPYFFIFNHWLLMMIGLGLNLVIKAYQNMENLNRIIEEQNQTLVQYARQIETLTLVEERNRMARDLHDTLGHSFISYIVGLDAILYLMDADTSEAKKKIGELRDYASVNLDQIRETIHEIGAQTDVSLRNNFSDIINEFSEFTNTKVTFQVTGEEYVLQHSLRMVLLRCLQESLTNAKRHGQATDISIHLSFLENNVELIIIDNGIGSDKLQYGFGLNSMKERLKTFNGELHIRSSKSEGTIVKCQIPFRR